MILCCYNNILLVSLMCCFVWLSIVLERMCHWVPSRDGGGGGGAFIFSLKGLKYYSNNHSLLVNMYKSTYYIPDSKAVSIMNMHSPTHTTTTYYILPSLSATSILTTTEGRSDRPTWKRVYFLDDQTQVNSKPAGKRKHASLNKCQLIAP